MLGFLFMFLLACNPPEEKVPTQPPEPAVVTYPWDSCANDLQQHACNFEGMTLSGIEELYQYYQRPIVLDFSTMWCGYCRVAGAEAQLMQDQYAEAGLVYITVLVENNDGLPPTAEDLEEWRSSMLIEDAPVWASSRDVIDLVDSTQGWSVTGWPTFYFIDRDMKIQALLKGYSHQMILDGIEIIVKEDTGGDLP